MPQVEPEWRDRAVRQGQPDLAGTAGP